MISNDWKTVDIQWTPEVGPIPVHDVLSYTRDSREEQELIARMWVMCAIEMQPKLQDATCSKPHFEKYRSFINTQYEQFQQPEYPQVPDSRELVAMSSNERLKLMNQLREKVKDTHMWAVIEGPWRVYENVLEIVEGRAKLVKILLKDGLLDKFYDWANGISEIKPLFNLMGRSNPEMRILEIGAGTGGTTVRVIEGLKSPNSQSLYKKYVYTDISPLFFDAAKKRFSACEYFDYRVLDITKEPSEQGFEEGTYDLVIASNVLHATPCLVDTLKNVRKLLKPNGFLFNQELSPRKKLNNYYKILNNNSNTAGKYVDYMVGMLPGWWLGEQDGRADGPTVPPAVWDERLKQAGFEGLHAVGLDCVPPFYYNANMLARPAIISP